MNREERRIRPKMAHMDSYQWTFSRATGQKHRQALAVLLTGGTDSSDPAVQQFLNFTRSQGLRLDELWVAGQGTKPIASVLIVPSAGHTAIMFLSPRSVVVDEVMPTLIQSACGGQDPQHLRLIQCLLDPSQEQQRQSLRAARFEDLAVLVYMQRCSEVRSSPPHFEDVGLTVLRWNNASRCQFATAITASYEATLDCPGLLGLRRIDEVIDGHQATGRFCPETWFVFCRGHDPIGVMLLNEAAQGDTFELVYLGLAKAFRRQGLARRILRFGLEVVHRRGVSGVILAVDERNMPAVNLYRGLGFRSTGRKVAMIYALPNSNSV